MHWNHVIPLAAAALGWAVTGAAQEVIPGEPPPVVIVQPPAGEKVPSTGLDRFVAAPTNAFELGVGFGYNQPFGDITSASSLSNSVAAGGQVELDLGYRVAPELMIGFYGTGSKYGTRGLTPEGSDVMASTAGVQAQWHFRPTRGLDPFVSLGTGWRGLWVKEPDIGTTSTQGWEIVRAQVGLDFRASSQVAISPVIGADLSMFLTQNPAGTDTYRSIPGHLNTFLFAGVMGRFDIGGQTATTGRYVAKQ